jgi:hypothetical protein
MRRILGIASMVGSLRGIRNGPKAAAGHVGQMSGLPESTARPLLVDHLARVERHTRAGMLSRERSLVTGNMPRRRNLLAYRFREFSSKSPDRFIIGCKRAIAAAATHPQAAFSRLGGSLMESLCATARGSSPCY